MALSYTQKTSDNSLITKYVRTNASIPFILSRRSHGTCGQQSLYDQFATYLTQNGLYMASQYSADDFAGPLANQTNLAVKVSILLGNLPSLRSRTYPPPSLSSRSRLRPRSSRFSGTTTRANSIMCVALCSPIEGMEQIVIRIIEGRHLVPPAMAKHRTFVRQVPLHHFLRKQHVVSAAGGFIVISWF